MNITVAPTIVVAESSIQAPPFLITESCNMITTTFYPPPYPYQTASATVKNPSVTITSGQPSPTCTSHCGHHCDIWCVGPCLLCIPRLFCGGGGIPQESSIECVPTLTSECQTALPHLPLPVSLPVLPYLTVSLSPPMGSKMLVSTRRSLIQRISAG